MTINRRWLVTLTYHIPAPIVTMEAARIGMNTRDFVRVTICGVNCGIWKFSN